MLSEFALNIINIKNVHDFLIQVLALNLNQQRQPKMPATLVVSMVCPYLQTGHYIY